MSKFKYISKNHFNQSKINENFRSSDDCDISQKIKSLESEGFKLRNQVEEILHESSQIQSSRTSAMTMESSETVNDDSEKQAFRNQMETNNDNRSSWRNRKSKYTESWKGIEDKEINEYKQKIESLQQQQKQDLFSYQLEKERQCDIIKQLRKENYRLQDDINKQMKEFHDMEAKYGSITERMRFNLEKLSSVNKKQEETLAESVTQLRHLEGAESALEAVEHLRNLLIDIEYYRGATLRKDNDVESCHGNSLINIVENCFKEYNFDLETRSRKMKDLEEEIVQIKRVMSHDKEMSMRELQNELDCSIEENNCLKQHMDEINENVGREIEALKDENNNIHMKMENEIKNASKIINDLECEILELSHKNQKLNEINCEEKKSFQKVIDDNEKQIAIIRAERDQAVNQKSSFTAKLDATQNQLSETETTLLQLQSDKYCLEKEVETFKKCLKEMEDSIKWSRKYFESIIKTIHACNLAADNYNNNYENFDENITSNDDSEDHAHIWKPKKYQIEEIIHQLKSFTKKENDADCRYEKLKKEYESIDKQLQVVDHQKRSTEQNYKAQELQIDSLKSENVHINGLMVNRNDEIERLTAERNYYFQLLIEKTEELTTVKSDKHRLVISLEERCKLLETQKNTNRNNDSQSHIIDTSLGKNRILKEERNMLLDELKETKAVYEDIVIRYEQDSNSLQRLRHENEDLQASLKHSKREHDDLIADNKRILLKFKDSENEISNLCRELQNSHGIRSRKHISLEKKVSELTTELTSTKNELKVAKENIKSFHRGNSKSGIKALQDINLVDVIESVPISDNLLLTKTRLRNLEQQMLCLETSQKDLKDENYKLMDLLKKVTSQNERMSEELDNYVTENSKLRSKVQLLNVEYSYRKDKMENISKKMKDESDYTNKASVHMDKDIVKPLLSTHTTENNESLKQLREDLQDSIKEAKRLLSNSSLTKKENTWSECQDKNIRNINSGDAYTGSSDNENGSASNNNNMDKFKLVNLVE